MFRSSAIIAALIFAATTADAESYAFTTISFPGGNATIGQSINNDGSAVGFFYNGSVNPGSAVSAFSYSNPNFVRYDVQNASNTADYGINDSGQIVGYWNYWDASGSVAYHGFLNIGGVVTNLDNPDAGNTSATGTLALGINNAGRVVGEYIDGSNNYHGFLYDGATYTSIDVPGYNFTQAFGINNVGQIVGTYSDGGFIYQNGSFTTFSVPGASRTSAYGINDLGQVVGDYLDSSGNPHAYVYSNGNFTAVDVMGAARASASGINNGGQLVGYFEDSNGKAHGFIASPVTVPLPPTALMFGSALAALGLRRRQTA